MKFSFYLSLERQALLNKKLKAEIATLVRNGVAEIVGGKNSKSWVSALDTELKAHKEIYS